MYCFAVYFALSHVRKGVVGESFKARRDWDETRVCHQREVVVTVAHKLGTLARFRPPSAGGIWKPSYVSAVRPTVHTNPSRKRSFSKTLFNWSNLKTPALRFSVDGKHFENGDFWKPWYYDKFSSTTNLKWQVTVAFSNCSGVMWTGENHFDNSNG